jgi:flavodoxin-like protein
MDAIVVYGSVYGNTREVAEAVAAGLGAARLLSLGEAAADVGNVGLLVVGGPTHMRGMATARGHAVAAHEATAPPDSDAPEEHGLREWLGELPRAEGARAAAFDTRLDRSPMLTGAASHGIAWRLGRHGYHAVETASFVVKDTEGPLAEGELDRARAWGAELARSAATPTSTDAR